MQRFFGASLFLILGLTYLLGIGPVFAQVQAVEGKPGSTPLGADSSALKNATEQGESLT